MRLICTVLFFLEKRILVLIQLAAWILIYINVLRIRPQLIVLVYFNQDTKSCSYYMRTGICKYGHVCKFHHPQPALATNLLPVAGPMYGSGGSAVMPSSGSSSASELSTAPLSKATYYATSLQHPQSYMPIYLSPSQGWNPYMVCHSCWIFLAQYAALCPLLAIQELNFIQTCFSQIHNLKHHSLLIEKYLELA